MSGSGKIEKSWQGRGNFDEAKAKVLLIQIFALKSSQILRIFKQKLIKHDQDYLNYYSETKKTNFRAQIK